MSGTKIYLQWWITEHGSFPHGAYYQKKKKKNLNLDRESVMSVFYDKCMQSLLWEEVREPWIFSWDPERLLCHSEELSWNLSHG